MKTIRIDGLPSIRAQVFHKLKQQFPEWIIDEPKREAARARLDGALMASDDADESIIREFAVQEHNSFLERSQSEISLESLESRLHEITTLGDQLAQDIAKLKKKQESK